MKKFGLLGGFVVAVIMGSTFSVKAQETDNNGYNPNSVHPIHESKILYKNRVWRRVDLEEKQNKPFFAFNNEISRFIIDAAKAGIIPIYKNDSLTTRMSKEEFLQNLQIPGMENMNAGPAGGGDNGWGNGGDNSGGDSGWGDNSGGNSGDSGWGGGSGGDQGGDKKPAMAVNTEFSPREVSIMEIMEDEIFDKERSRLYYDIQSIKLVIPAKRFPSTGLERSLGVFKFKDLVKLFKSKPEYYIWFNPQNTGANLNLVDAFELRLFGSHLIKIANPDNAYLTDIYSKSPKQGIMASQWMEYKLMEEEHNLWSY